MNAIRCPSCGYTFSLEGKEELSWTKRGYSCRCPHCGVGVSLIRPAHLKQGKIHMSKKERLRLRRQELPKA